MKGVKFNGCSRRSKYRIVCRFYTDGRSRNYETRCNLTVVVRGEGSRASTRLRSNCRRERSLSFQRARTAIESAADRIAGQRTQLVEIGRRNRTTIYGEAAWTKKGAPREACSVELIANLLNSGEVSVVSRFLECLPA